jgi:hypothetical protein
MKPGGKIRPGKTKNEQEKGRAKEKEKNGAAAPSLCLPPLLIPKLKKNRERPTAPMQTVASNAEAEAMMHSGEEWLPAWPERTSSNQISVIDDTTLAGWLASSFRFFYGKR